MRPEYDFSGAVRGATAARYAQGANIAVIDPDVLDVFPDGATVNRRYALLHPFFGSNAGLPRSGRENRRPFSQALGSRPAR